MGHGQMVNGNLASRAKQEGGAEVVMSPIQRHRQKHKTPLWNRAPRKPGVS